MKVLAWDDNVARGKLSLLAKSQEVLTPSHPVTPKHTFYSWQYLTNDKELSVCILLISCIQSYFPCITVAQAYAEKWLVARVGLACACATSSSSSSQFLYYKYLQLEVVISS